MLDWLTLDLLGLALLGAVFGAVISFAHYAWRDRAYLFQRWRERRGLAGEAAGMELDEGYQAHPVTDEERFHLPGTVAFFASLGFCLGAAFAAGDPLALFWAFIGLTLCEILFILIAHPRRLWNEAVPDPDEPEPSRWQRVKDRIFIIACFVALMALWGPGFRTLVAWGVGDLVLFGGFAGLALLMLWYWVQDIRNAQDEPMNWSERLRSKEQRFQELGWPIIALVMAAMFFVIVALN